MRRPASGVVHLNSIGGRVGEGYQIYQMVRDRKLATYTATDCVSRLHDRVFSAARKGICRPRRALAFTASVSAVSIRSSCRTSTPTCGARWRHMGRRRGSSRRRFRPVRIRCGIRRTGTCWPQRSSRNIVDPRPVRNVGHRPTGRDREGLERGLLAMPFYAPGPRQTTRRPSRRSATGLRKRSGSENPSRR